MKTILMAMLDLEQKSVQTNAGNYMLFKEGFTENEMIGNEIEMDYYNVRLIVGISVILMMLIMGLLFVFNKFESTLKKAFYKETLPLLRIIDSEEIYFDMDNL